MKLHIKNLTLGAGASESERVPLQKRLEQLLVARKKISLTDALQVLQRIREGARTGISDAVGVGSTNTATPGGSPAGEGIKGDLGKGNSQGL